MGDGYQQLPITPFHQQDPMESFSKLQALRQMGQQYQMNQQDMQIKQQQMADERALTRAINEANGDPEQAGKLALKYGASANRVAAFQEKHAQLREQISKTAKEDLDLHDKQYENLRGAISPLMDLAKQTPQQPTMDRNQQFASMASGGGQPSGESVDGTNPSAAMPSTAAQDPLLSKKQQIWTQQRASVVQNPGRFGFKNTDEATKYLPEQYPGDDWIAGHNALLATGHTLVQEANERMTAEGRKAQGDAALAKQAPLPFGQVVFLNKQLQNRYQVLNPGQPLPPEYSVPQGSNRQTYEDISASLEKLENAATARANRIQAQATQGGARADARADKSYQFNSTQLEKVAAPVDQAIARISRLQESIAQHSPQADALIAPELLSVMAGGSGSGLRMNEAEIARVIGGRSAWQDLQATLNKWSADPTHVQIPEAQRKQISDLVNAVDAKLKAKQIALDEARQGLINSNDPDEHKRIVAKARGAMTQIDQGAAAQPSNAKATSLQVGQKVTLKNGKTVTIKAVHSDGSFDAE